MKFLVIEGVDGSGKSTQIKKMINHLESLGKPYRYIHFPRTESPVYGGLIARFLRGDFGDLNSVDPYLVALLYAGDRKDAAPMVAEWLSAGYFVLLDRYVYSNIAYQCAKLTAGDQQDKLSQWILDLEYNYNRLPRPDLNLLLDVPFSFTANKLRENREGIERDYLQGSRDIHEEDLDFQQRVRNVYLQQAAANPDLKIISCMAENGTMLPPDDIFASILDLIDLSK
jgi:dTMP kinase